MCGIVGGLAKTNIVPFLIDGLKRLEYRGYDSSGVAVIAGATLDRARATGRVSEMEASALAQGLQGGIGIGHTRWATHGGVTERNAHPIFSRSEIAVVHNGIIENHETQRARLRELGYAFDSQTDTEVIAHLIHYHRQSSASLRAAVQKAVRELHGAFAIGVIEQSSPDELVAARQGCPLLVGVAEGESFIASDVSALLSQTRRVIYLEDGDLAHLQRGAGVTLYNAQGGEITRAIHTSEATLDALEKGPYAHFMQKEIFEQPRAVADTIEALIDNTSIDPALFGEQAAAVFADTQQVLILAAGTSYYAGCVARDWIERIAKIPCTIELAHEYRYRESVPNPKQLVVTISQSGETLDTLEGLKRAIALGHSNTLSICNVREAAIPRLSKLVFYTRAGAEIGVASTKAFTTQLVALYTLALCLGKSRGALSVENEAAHIDSLRYLPGSIQYALNLEPQIIAWAQQLVGKQHALFLGRGLHYPIALEGALKLKETMPVVFIAPNDTLLEKVKSNMQEVRARGGELFVFADADSHFEASDGVHVIRTPRHVGLLSPIIHAIPVQLLAYHTAVKRGTDVDKPRNLAKSVTVE
jgi:glutamine---fructose-6-phosphate transaminase (isomerizing)